jgi:uncharacterized protein Usg
LILNSLFTEWACNDEGRDWKLSSDSTEDVMVSLVSKEATPRGASEDFKKQVEGYGLTTAHILYRRPDHHWLLQSYVWQAYDLFPKFPELQRFLQFWQDRLEGPLHSVQVAHSRLIKPAELKAIGGEFRLH